MPNTIRTWWIDLCLLTIMVTLLYTLFLGMRPLAPPDEGRYSEIPREMVASGDYITPHLDGVKYFEKPVLFYWLQSISIKLFGLNEWSLRLVNALMGILGSLMTYIGARQLYNRRVALLSGVLLSSAFLYAAMSHFITLDMTMATFLTGCLLSFIVGVQKEAPQKKYYFWSMYLCAGLATLTKGLIGIVFPGAIIFAWLLLTQNWRQMRTYCLFSGTCLFLLITVPWHILVGNHNPGFFKFYFYEQHFLRYFTDYAGRGQKFYFLPGILLLGCYPWTGFLLSAIKYYARCFLNAKQYATEVYFLLWPSIIFIFYWLSHSQLAPYLLPIFAPLAIITGRFLDEMLSSKTDKVKFGFITLAVISFFLCLAGCILLWKFPSIIPNSLIITTLLAILLMNLISIITYLKKGLKNALVMLLISNLFFLGMFYYSSSYFQGFSVKTLAETLKPLLKPDDMVFNYNHYFQDFPVYIEKTVILLNWKGELQFGSTHEPPPQTFMHENCLWNEWQSKERKFVIMQIKDFEETSAILKSLKFYPIAYTKKHVLVCNKEIK